MGGLRSARDDRRFCGFPASAALNSIGGRCVADDAHEPCFDRFDMRGLTFVGGAGKRGFLPVRPNRWGPASMRGIACNGFQPQPPVGSRLWTIFPDASTTTKVPQMSALAAAPRIISMSTGFQIKIVQYRKSRGVTCGIIMQLDAIFLRSRIRPLKRPGCQWRLAAALHERPAATQAPSQASYF